MHIYLPIAEMSVNIFLILGMGGSRRLSFWPVWSWGWLFNDAPIDIYRRATPVAVGTEANQIVASSVSGSFAHWQRKQCRFQNGFCTSSWRIFLDPHLSNIIQIFTNLGQLDLVIKLSYVIFLGIIGFLMLWESSRTIIRSRSAAARRGKLHQHN